MIVQMIIMNDELVVNQFIPRPLVEYTTSRGSSRLFMFKR